MPRRDMPPDEALDNRSRLLKICMAKGLSPSQIAGMTRPMRGKTNSEKERLAAQLIEQLSTEQQNH